jgi:hypothetical protein
MLPVIKTIWVTTCMTLQIVDKPITLAMKNYGANNWLQRGCYPPCEVAKNNRPGAYPLGFSQTQISNCNL